MPEEKKRKNDNKKSRRENGIDGISTNSCPPGLVVSDPKRDSNTAGMASWSIVGFLRRSRGLYLSRRRGSSRCRAAG
jgi:hypothetical protein